MPLGIPAASVGHSDNVIQNTLAQKKKNRQKNNIQLLLILSIQPYTFVF